MVGRKQVTPEIKEAIARIVEGGATVRDVSSQFQVEKPPLLELSNVSRRYRVLRDSGERLTEDIIHESVGLIAKGGSKKDGGRCDEACEHAFGNEYQRMNDRAHPQTRRLFARHPAKRPLISKKSKRARLKFAR